MLQPKFIAKETQPAEFGGLFKQGVKGQGFEEAEASELEDLLEDKISSLQRRVRESQQGD